MPMRCFVVIDDCAAECSFKDLNEPMACPFWSYSVIIVVLLVFELAVNHLRFKSISAHVSHFNFSNLRLNVEVVSFLHPLALVSSKDFIGLPFSFDLEYLNLRFFCKGPGSHLIMHDFTLGATVMVTVC
jgi:hypothetical protein